MKTINESATKDYTATINVNANAEKSFECINNISQWWSENFEGSTERLNDVWTVYFGEPFVTAKVIELVPDKKITWEVIDCDLSWFKDKKEWNGTKMTWEILPAGDSTQIDFTHVGLVPEVECYESCVKGWDQYAKESLHILITEGAGEPQKKKN